MCMARIPCRWWQHSLHKAKVSGGRLKEKRMSQSARAYALLLFAGPAATHGATRSYRHLPQVACCSILPHDCSPVNWIVKIHGSVDSEVGFGAPRPQSAPPCCRSNSGPRCALRWLGLVCRQSKGRDPCMDREPKRHGLQMLLRAAGGGTE